MEPSTLAFLVKALVTLLCLWIIFRFFDFLSSVLYAGSILVLIYLIYCIYQQVTDVQSPGPHQSSYNALFPPPLQKILLLSVVASLLPLISTLDSSKLVIVVMSQSDAFSSHQVNALRHHLQQQALESQKQPVLQLLHSEFHESGAWTIVPILPKLVKQHEYNTSWVIFCEPRTRLNIDRLTDLLSKNDPRKPVWLGHALYDREPTIIHHFALLNKKKFLYPNFSSGFAMSMTLLKRLVLRLNNGDWPQTDFSIDVSYEFSLFVWDEGRGTALTQTQEMCLAPGPNCVSYPVPFTPCGDLVPLQTIFFAVKTCHKFHNTRVPVVMQTWAKYAQNLVLYSDSVDSSVPQVLDLGVPNTEQGHCGKTIAILKHVSNYFKQHIHMKWLILADDDTILSVGRLQELLTCYESPANTTLIVLGERYGYRAQEVHGYSYITGGGGTVLSREVVMQLTAPGACDCPAPTAPDDMYMGLCLAHLNVPIVHSPFFHQARPMDYAPEYLLSQHPVSFHKHWMIDPIQVYKKWFEESDNQISRKTNVHTEL